MKKTLTSLCALLVTLFAVAQDRTQFIQGEAGTLNKRVSPNGKYVVGENPLQHSWGVDAIVGFESFIKNLETGETDWVTSFDAGDFMNMGSFSDVTDDGVICGTMKDPDYMLTIEDIEQMFILPLNVAAVWKDGKPISLGLGTYSVSDFSSFADGTFATAISNDAKTVVGYVATGNYASVHPCGWVLNDATGKYDFVEYAVPANTVEARISDVSGDGRVAVGYCRSNLGTGQSQACFWPSPSECVVIEGDGGSSGLLSSLCGQAFVVSDNGEFIGATTDGLEPVLYSVLDREIRRKLGTHDEMIGLEIGGVSNNGDVVGVYKYSGYTRPFWYSMDNIITTDFDYYLYLYCQDADIPYHFDFWSRESLVFSGMSADGKTMVGNVDYGGPWALVTEPYIALIPPTVGSLTAVSTGLGEVTVSFKRIELEEYMSLKADGYVVYRDGKEAGRVLVEDLDAEGLKDVTYVDKNAGFGTRSYAVAVLYKDSNTGKDMLSPKCNEENVFLESSYEFPLYDNFDSQSIATNGWTVWRDYGDKDFQQWGCMPYFGIDASSFLITSVVETAPYSYSVVSRHLDAKDKESVYMTFARMWQFSNGSDWQTDKDSLSIEVSSDGLNWVSVKDMALSDVTANLWSFEYVDLTPYAAGKVFQVRLRAHGQALAQYIWSIENITIDEKPQHEGPKAPMGKALGDGSFRLTWKNSLDAYSLNYLANVYSNAFTLTVGDEGKPFIAVNKFSPEDLDLYKGKYLTSITTEINKYESEDQTPLRVALVVYENGTLVREQEIVNPDYNKYLTVKLDEPVLIDGNKELMFGIKLLEYGADQMPIIYHNTMKFVDGKSNLYSQDGGNTWKSLNDYYVNVPEHETDGCASWFITGNVTDTQEAPIDFMDTNQYCYEVYKNGQKYSDLFVHFMQSGYTDENSVEGDTYEVRTFYLDGTVSELSNTVKNSGSTGIDDVVAGGVADEAYSVDGDELNVNGNNAKVEIYNSNGVKVYEGSGRNVGLDAFGHGVFVLKVYAADGSSTVHKFMF